MNVSIGLTAKNVRHFQRKAMSYSVIATYALLLSKYSLNRNYNEIERSPPNVVIKITLSSPSA